MVVVEFTFKTKKTKGTNGGQVGRPRKKKKKQLRLYLTEELYKYFNDYRNHAGKNYAGSEHAEELIRLGLAMKNILPLLLADRSEEEIAFVLSQLPTNHIKVLVAF